MSSSFLSLILKVDHSQSLNNYRPICLIESLHKIQSKLLDLMLKRIIGLVISMCKSTFVSWRQNLEWVLVLWKLIDLAKRRKRHVFLTKSRFQKGVWLCKFDIFRIYIRPTRFWCQMDQLRKGLYLLWIILKVNQYQLGRRTQNLSRATSRGSHNSFLISHHCRMSGWLGEQGINCRGSCELQK